MFRLAYNTNGLAHHRLDDALRLLSDLGYEGVAITPDVGVLDPLSSDQRALEREVEQVRRTSEQLGLALAIESGARFVLDARRKHFPTLLEERAEDRARRVDFLVRSLDLAAGLGAGVVSFWAGRSPSGVSAESPPTQPGADPSSAGAQRELAWQRLVDGVQRVLDAAREREVVLAFEPEPGMFVERPAGYRELCQRLGSDGQDLFLCLDVGHLLCTADLPVAEVIGEYAPRLAQVHLDDIRDGVHEHCMFGDGDLDLAETLGALLRSDYAGLAAVELSRDSHRGAWAAEEALQRIGAALGEL